VPVRLRRYRLTSVLVQAGHESCSGKVTTPHAAHRLPIKCGSSSGQVNSPSATGRATLPSDPTAVTLLDAL
jgi:hypothetical protein